MIVKGYAVVWGHEYERDLQGEYFTPSTDFGNINVVDEKHLLVMYTPNGNFVNIGDIHHFRRDDYGLFFEGEIYENEKTSNVARAVIDMLKVQKLRDGKVGFSFVPRASMVKTSEDNRIDIYKIDALILTPTPSDPRTSITDI